MMRIGEPTDVLVVLVPSPFLGRAVELERSMAAVIQKGAVRVPLLLRSPGAHSSVSLLFSHTSLESAAEASPLLKKHHCKTQDRDLKPQSCSSMFPHVPTKYGKGRCFCAP